MTSNKIPLVDLTTQYRLHQAEFDQAVAKTLANSSFIGGIDHQSFRERFSAWCGDGDTALLGNGTDALELAIIGLIGEGNGTDEIITASHTFIGTSEAISRAGYRPIFVDIDPATYLVDLGLMERAITPRTKALLPVHLYGQMVDMRRVADIAARHNLVVIEDAAQAHGARFDGVGVGEVSAAACFSFYPGKNLGAWGDGGAVYSRDRDLIARIAKLANHGRTQKYLHEQEGRNSRLDGLQAAVLNVKLSHMSAWNSRRREIAARYDERLSDLQAVTTPFVDPRAESVFHLYVVRIPDRDGVLARMAEAGIGCGVHFPVPLHEQPAYSHLQYRPQDLPHTSLAAQSILSLPIYPELTDEQVDRVADTLRTCLPENPVPLKSVG